MVMIRNRWAKFWRARGKGRMSITSPDACWNPTWERYQTLPDGVKERTRELYNHMTTENSNMDRYNHELFHLAMDKAESEHSVFKTETETEYQETLRAMELWEEML